VRGAPALARLQQLSGAPLPEVGALALRRLSRADDELDEALLVRVDATSCELHLHGSPVLVASLERALAAGTEEPASDGIEALALCDLASAVSEAGARLLLDQARGALRRSAMHMARMTPARRERAWRAMHQRARVADFLLHPRRVLLAGPPNAGKSTLFNLLVGSDRALVSAQPGTTRDLVEGLARLGPWPIVAVDSAGLDAGGAPSADPIGALAQQRALAELARADLVLWCDPGASAPPEAGSRVAVLATRGDLPGRAAALAALEDPGAALERIEGVYRARFDLPARLLHPGSAAPFRAAQLEELRGTALGWLGAAPPIEGPRGLL
ncbi:MAG: hypothetical protein FJ299_06640, partial [Planctomycetes bacterium]|nr:hypothetical protein [Planctomycetota bacterium]